ncbi:SubName: Full=Uncharacterized protein {ECO:0000313/EMBL:CCA72022.1} [Serendipita indica DSM 11827]|nr:SubName: Full=Uncharacterized protein {ECO:0000313/EMBL:CCA72022.1} [Serendipita indica DSM 11827]
MSTFDPTLLTGPLLLGHILNSFLYGIELIQFYRYRTAFRDDKAWNRRLVLTIVILDTLQTGFSLHNAWMALGSGWGREDEILHPEWTWGSVPLFTGIVSFLVQGFYAFRISKLVESRYTKYIVSVIVLVSIAQGFCGIFSGIYYAIGSFRKAQYTIAAVTTTWLGGTALCDLMISTTIVAYLMIQLAAFKPKDTVVSRVIQMTVTTSLLTTSFASADLVLFLLYPNNNLHLIFCIPLAKLYSNTLLAMLNARKGSFLQDDPAEASTSVRVSFRKPEKIQREPSADESFSTGEPKAERDEDTSSSITHVPPPLPAPISTAPPSSSRPPVIPPTAVSTTIRWDASARMETGNIPRSPMGSNLARRRSSANIQPLAMATQSGLASQKRKDHTPRGVGPSSSGKSRPTKSQANADFDSQLPSILDLSVDDDSFRTRFLNKFR